MKTNTHAYKVHAKLNELITNLNAHVRIWMLEKTLPGTVANLNALDAYLNLNDVNAKFLDRSANLKDRSTNLNYGFHGPDLFREFEWLLHQIEWQICEIDRENIYIYNLYGSMMRGKIEIKLYVQNVPNGYVYVAMETIWWQESVE